jgi:hypothetical protein
MTKHYELNVTNRKCLRLCSSSLSGNVSKYGKCDLAECECDLAECECDLAECGCDLDERGCDLAECGCDLAECGCDLAECGCDLAECGTPQEISRQSRVFFVF